MLAQSITTSTPVVENGPQEAEATAIPSLDAPQNQLKPLGEKIFLDRYAFKDAKKETLQVGDTVIVCIDIQTAQREIGTVTAIKQSQVTIALRNGDTVTVAVEHIDKPLETHPEQMMARVAQALAAVETTPEKQAEWREKFRWLLDGWKFVPGGRILTGAGTDQNLTFYNCMPPEQEVLTSTGYKPIAEINVGDLVVTHRNRLRRVQHKFERDTAEAIYIIDPKKVGYDRLRLTGDHKILVIRSEWVNKHRSGDGLRLQYEPAWIAAKDLNPNDYVAVGHNGEERSLEAIYVSDYLSSYEVKDEQIFKPGRRGGQGDVKDWGTHYAINNKLLVDETLCYLFGRWLGAGCVTHRSGTAIPSGIKIVFSLVEKEAAEEIAHIIKRKFGLEASLNLSRTEKWYDLWVNSMSVGEFFKAMFGAYRHLKQIPHPLTYLSKPLTLALLKGLFTADGYISDNTVGIVLSNRRLTIQIHQLLLRLGYLFSIKENTHNPKGRMPAYRVQATANECQELFEAFFDTKAPEYTTDLKLFFEYDDLRWVRVSSIAVEDYVGTVYDLTVEEDHSFISAGLVVSNCYVVPSPHDRRGGIMQTLAQMTEIMSRGGGVGINLSTLRPHHAYVKGVNGRSSGAVSWGGLYSFVTGLIEQGGCLTPDTLVFTAQGLLRLDEIVSHPKKGWHKHELTMLTDEGPRLSRQVYNHGVSQVLRVQTDMGLDLTGTPNHKVKIMTQAGPNWRRLDELQQGDAIIVQLGQHHGQSQILAHPCDHHHNQAKVELPPVLDEDLAFFLGYFAGAGFMIEKDGPWRLGVNIAQDSYLRQAIPELLEKLFSGVNIRSQQKENEASETLIISHRAIKEFLRLNGFAKSISHKTSVPRLIRQSPPEIVGAYLRGLFEADGDISHHYPILLGSSRTRVYEVAILLIGLGCPVKIDTLSLGEEHDGDVPADRRPLWRLRIHSPRGLENWRRFIGSASSSRFAVCFDFEPSLSPAVNYVLPHSEKQPNFAQQARPLNDRWFVFVEQVISAGSSLTLDLEVDDNHTYIANGLVTHNSRRGALMLILNVWHPDVGEFINSKRKMDRITNANISVGITDDFMEAVKQDRTWDFIFPDTSVPDYDEIWDGDIRAWQAAGRPIVVHKTVPAREIWDNIIESAWASAEPGIFFVDRYNYQSNSWYFAPIACTNPCTTGDTFVATEYGYTQAKDLQVGMRIRTAAGLKPIEKIYNNGLQRIYRVEFSDGGYLECTGEHKLKVVRNKKYEWVAVSALHQGDKVLVSANEAFGPPCRLPTEAIAYIQKHGLNVSRTYDHRLGLAIGVVIGTGSLRRLPVAAGHSDQCEIAFGASEEAWVDKFVAWLTEMNIQPQKEKDTISGGDGTAVRQIVRLHGDKLATLMIKVGLQPNLKAPDKVIPETFLKMDKAFLAGILDGLFSTDRAAIRLPSVLLTQDKPSLRFHTVSYSLAQQVRLLLLQFGIHGRIYTTGDEVLGYEVVVMNESLARFYAEIGLSHPEKAKGLKDVVENWHFSGGTWTAAVLSVQDTEREEAVYDVYEPQTLTWVTNGYVSLDCGEQGLPAWGVCNLGALHLARFVQNGRVDWSNLGQAVRVAVRFLDNVIDGTPYFFEENARQQLGERRVGLGSMGLAEMLIRLKIRYGSPECITFLDTLYQFIAQEAYLASTEYAAEKGVFPKFETAKFLQSGFMQTMSAEVQQAVREKGIRNVTLLTQAPTGTTGTMVGTSTGIEPYYFWEWERLGRMGSHLERVDVYDEWLSQNAKGSDGAMKLLPPYFVTAMDLKPEDHVRVQAVIQKWVDSSISKTCNTPNDYTIEQTRQLYELMYELGCKGGTIYRDGSRDQQVLNLTQAEEGEAPPPAISARVRPLTLQGQTYRKHTPIGTAYITVNVSDEDDDPFEVFINASKAGSDVAADAEGLGRLISLILRMPSPLSPEERVQDIIAQLRGIGSGRPQGFGPNRVMSLPDAVAQTLAEHIGFNPHTSLPGLPDEEEDTPRQFSFPPSEGDFCPICGAATLILIEGCKMCYSCGYSVC